MAKVLVSKKRKEFIEELNREVVVSKPRKYYVQEDDKDFHAAEGIISKEDMAKEDGTLIQTSKGKEFNVFSPSFIDDFKRIKRLPQVIPLKDIGFIIAETGIGKDSRVIDAGSGSGAVACFLARHVKEVFSYDIKKEHTDVANYNKEFLGLDNVTFKTKNIYLDVEETDIDLILYDLPEPWEGIESAEKALKVGGFLISYSPSMSQVSDFADRIKDNPKFETIKTIEIIERPWQVEDRKIRPKTMPIAHSGFLTIVRRIGK